MLQAQDANGHPPGKDLESLLRFRLPGIVSRKDFFPGGHGAARRQMLLPGILEDQAACRGHSRPEGCFGIPLYRGQFEIIVGHL